MARAPSSNPRTLILLRHGDAVHHDDDVIRELSPQGRSSCTRVGLTLRRAAPAVELVLLSSSQRTRQTAELVLQELGGHAELQPLESLYLATANTCLDVVRQVHKSVSCVLLVGHNPGLSEFATHLSGLPRSLGTADYEIFRFDLDSWASLHV